MPVKTSDIPARFDPQYVTDEDLADLASFTRMSADDCLERLCGYSTNEMAEAWRAKNPSTPSEIMEFYRSTDLYVWELMQWHASAARAPYWDALYSFVESHPPSHGFNRVFDFGCGVGTDALFLAERGYDVTAVDVDGSAFEFARHRFLRRGLNARFVESTSEIPRPDVNLDAAICFDVFEHLSDPLGAAQALINALRPGGILLQQGAFGDNDLRPCHMKSSIERFSGLRWHINLAGMGMKQESSLNYLKCSGLDGWMQKARYGLWRATGLWLVKAGD